MTTPEMAPIDLEALKIQVGVYKRLKQDGYMESAGKELEDIERKLERIQSKNPAQYDDLQAFFGL